MAKRRSRQMRYRTLDPKLIIDTAERLEERVAERFPRPGCAGFRPNWCRCRATSPKRRRSNRLSGGCAAPASRRLSPARRFSFSSARSCRSSISRGRRRAVGSRHRSLAQHADAWRLGLLGLIRAEEGIKRKRVFRDLHGLRSLIHVIDMHQLTKDPNICPPASADREFAGADHRPFRACGLSRLLLGNAVDHRQGGGAVCAVGQ